MKKNVRNYIVGAYLLIYSIASLVVFAMSTEYLFATFTAYTTIDLSSVLDSYVAIVDGLMCLQLFCTLFSGLIGLSSIVRSPNGRKLRIAGCLGILSKVLYIFARIVSALRYSYYSDMYVIDYNVIFNCLLPIVYIPFSVLVLAIGAREVRREEGNHEKWWFPFFRIR